MFAQLQRKDYVQTASGSLPQHRTLGLKHVYQSAILEEQQAGGRTQGMSTGCCDLVPHLPTHLLCDHSLSGLSFSDR